MPATAAAGSTVEPPSAAGVAGKVTSVGGASDNQQGSAKQASLAWEKMMSPGDSGRSLLSCSVGAAGGASGVDGGAGRPGWSGSGSIFSGTKTSSPAPARRVLEEGERDGDGDGVAGVMITGVIGDTDGVAGTALGVVVRAINRSMKAVLSMTTVGFDPVTIMTGRAG